MNRENIREFVVGLQRAAQEGTADRYLDREKYADAATRSFADDKARVGRFRAALAEAGFFQVLGMIYRAELASASWLRVLDVQAGDHGPIVSISFGVADDHPMFLRLWLSGDPTQPDSYRVWDAQDIERGRSATWPIDQPTTEVDRQNLAAALEIQAATDVADDSPSIQECDRLTARVESVLGGYLPGQLRSNLYQAVVAKNGEFESRRGVGLRLLGRWDNWAREEHVDPVRYYHRALLHEGNEPREVLKAAETYRRLVGESPKMLEVSGFAHLQLGDPRSAEQDFMTLVEGWPTSVHAYMGLLFSVPPSRDDELVRILTRAGAPFTSCIVELAEGSEVEQRVKALYKKSFPGTPVLPCE